MLEQPVLLYARRIVLVSGLYAMLVLLLVWMPVQTILLCVRQMLPYRVMLGHSMELLTFHLCLPLLQVRDCVC